MEVTMAASWWLHMSLKQIADERQLEIPVDDN
jgi:hypothetical protein